MKINTNQSFELNTEDIKKLLIQALKKNVGKTFPDVPLENITMSAEAEQDQNLGDIAEGSLCITLSFPPAIKEVPNAAN